MNKTKINKSKIKLTMIKIMYIKNIKKIPNFMCGIYVISYGGL